MVSYERLCMLPTASEREKIIDVQKPLKAIATQVDHVL